MVRAGEKWGRFAGDLDAPRLKSGGRREGPGERQGEERIELTGGKEGRNLPRLDPQLASVPLTSHDVIFHDSYEVLRGLRRINVIPAVKSSHPTMQ